LPSAKTKPEFWYDEEAAEKPVKFFAKHLRHTKGEHAGQPFHLLPWQADVTRKIFGWKRRDGSRKYRRVYIEVPRKNGKSQWAGGIGNYLLFADGEAGAEVYSAAADKEQAAIVFNAAKDMLESAPSLVKRSTALRRSIVVEGTKSSYKVLSSDVKTKHGLNASGIIFDELHTQPNRDLWDVLTTSTGARWQPLTVAITTAGYDRHSICWEQHDYAVKVMEGTIDDPSFLGVIYSAPDDADWSDPDVWEQANPSIDVTILRDYLQTECDRAKETPGYVNTFRRLHLNQWTESSSRWLNMEAWNECGEPINPAELEGQACWGGLDLATTTDLAAFALVFPRDEGFATLMHFWTPEETIAARARADRVPYDMWAREGWIEPTNGNVIDYGFIRKRINELSEKYRIQEIGFDPWNATGLVNDLMEDGANMVVVRQGYLSLNAPAKELEKLVASRQLSHGGNPVLTWCAANVVVEMDPAGNLKPSKAKSTERIDGIVALIIALSRAIVGEGNSVYEERGLLIL
jgi:phage terminase large subunit-like protein